MGKIGKKWKTVRISLNWPAPGGYKDKAALAISRITEFSWVKATNTRGGSKIDGTSTAGGAALTSSKQHVPGGHYDMSSAPPHKNHVLVKSKLYGLSLTQTP